MTLEELKYELVKEIKKEFKEDFVRELRVLLKDLKYNEQTRLVSNGHSLKCQVFFEFDSIFE